MSIGAEVVLLTLTASVGGTIVGQALRPFADPVTVEGVSGRHRPKVRLRTPVAEPFRRLIGVAWKHNLGSHKGPGVGAAIEAAGARLLYLPPYSPDFNPIENAFSKLKALLRRAAERSVDGLWAAIARIATLIEPNECANFYKAAGYDPD